ncbi:hypothetical protein [Streptomyces sp. SID8499]|uniref:DUF6197 family protein n=1 Tax=Streptomyces sp. SID8499 TaxID=2706106 RepID=UPI0013C86C8F|nr:hypothetical protein [Streptomyces sp. SID8499]NED31074.1 hypothetical protein [Streptomyces sp. SID8499]
MSAKPAPVLDLDARLALASAVMGERITLAHLAVDINTAHLPAADPLPEITAPPHIVPQPEPCPYSTPIATVLWRAQQRLQEYGWLRGQLRDEQGAACAAGHIRAVAHGRDEYEDARAVLLEVVRRDFGADGIPAWNDAQTSPAPVLLAFGRAAELAHTRQQ